MNTDRPKYLFWQRYSGKITPEEEHEFIAFINNPQDKALVEDCIAQFLEDSPDLPLLSQEKVEETLYRIYNVPAVVASSADLQTAPVAPIRRRPVLRFLTNNKKWIAAASVLFVIGTYFWLTHKSEVQSLTN